MMKFSMVLGFLVIAGFTIFGIADGGSLLLFINIPSLMIVFGAVVGGVLISFGFYVPRRAVKNALFGSGVEALDDLRLYVIFSICHLS